MPFTRAASIKFRALRKLKIVLATTSISFLKRGIFSNILFYLLDQCVLCVLLDALGAFSFAWEATLALNRVEPKKEEQNYNRDRVSAECIGSDGVKLIAGVIKDH